MEQESFDKAWENNIYEKGKHMNEYPYEVLVSIIARKFYNVPFEERKNIKILDLGCGAGNNSVFLAEKGFDVYGIDGSSTAIERCKQRFKAKDLKGTFKVVDFLNLPFEDNFFDCIIDRESIYANTRENIINIIDLAYDKLKDKGIIVSFFFNSKHPDIKYGQNIGKNTYHNFSEGGFSKTGKAYFIELEEIPIFFKRYTIENVTSHSYRTEIGKVKWLGECEEYIIICKKDDNPG